MITNAIQQKRKWTIAMAEPCNDDTLAIRLTAGDETALHELYAEYGKRLFAYALRLTNDHAKAEDVVQDVLVTVWRTAYRYRGEGRFIAWLLGIVHHTAMNAIRHTSIAISDAMEDTIASNTLPPENLTQRNMQSEWVKQGLESLDSDHRAVLELVFYQGLSMEEIAKVCQIPLGTVKSRLSYARQKLKGILIRQNAEEWR
ncbi:MAG: hypothetical protein CVU42_11170 [Chloroflexi bacterium HGW-Chloroflexi-4]|jgi:RNA polymerase sigma-70 factor (ECF subfamily)|nr:MAG: hypothetical protein CVU42_11170 [Chloroflexi bacterium HGW-Chloroflexi-4]